MVQSDIKNKILICIANSCAYERIRQYILKRSKCYICIITSFSCIINDVIISGYLIWIMFNFILFNNIWFCFILFDYVFHFSIFFKLPLFIFIFLSKFEVLYLFSFAILFHFISLHLISTWIGLFYLKKNSCSENIYNGTINNFASRRSKLNCFPFVLEYIFAICAPDSIFLKLSASSEDGATVFRRVASNVSTYSFLVERMISNIGFFPLSIQDRRFYYHICIIHIYYMKYFLKFRRKS